MTLRWATVVGARGALGFYQLTKTKFKCGPQYLSPLPQSCRKVTVASRVHGKNRDTVRCPWVQPSGLSPTRQVFAVPEEKVSQAYQAQSAECTRLSPAFPTTPTPPPHHTPRFHTTSTASLQLSFILSIRRHASYHILKDLYCIDLKSAIWSQLSARRLRSDGISPVATCFIACLSAGVCGKRKPLPGTPPALTLSSLLTLTPPRLSSECSCLSHDDRGFSVFIVLSTLSTSVLLFCKHFVDIIVMLEATT
jgi:hypothetical protein